MIGKIDKKSSNLAKQYDHRRNNPVSKYFCLGKGAKEGGNRTIDA
jgi:hypothetical protein